MAGLHSPGGQGHLPWARPRAITDYRDRPRRLWGASSLGFHLPPQGTVPAGHRGVCWWPPDKRHPECRNPGRARGRSHDGWRGCARVQPAGTQQPEGVPTGQPSLWLLCGLRRSPTPRLPAQDPRAGSTLVGRGQRGPEWASQQGGRSPQGGRLLQDQEHPLRTCLSPNLGGW